MNVNNVEFLSRLSNFVQISVLVLIFISAFLQVSKFFIDSNIKRLEKLQIQERFSNIESKPNFDQRMWEMLTGIPASIFRIYHSALDLYDAKEYASCAKTVQSAIDEYQNVDEWIEGYDIKLHDEKISEIYILAAKCAGHLGKREFSYQNAKKALSIYSSHYNYYAASVAAYNLKKYRESLELINKAIELKPPESKPQMSTYENIKERCMEHLGIGKK
jgi:tetratricopeptide (TPR) repeat protein